MELTAEERDILEGAKGEGTALAMKIMVGIGEAFDAPRLVPITRAHAALSNQEADLWFAEKLSGGGARCVIPPTVNPGYCLEYFTPLDMASEADTHLMERTRDAYRALGARLSYSCTPYLFDNIPRLGEIIAFSESSATPFVNSVWGARTNRESAQSALCAAVIGKVPEYGLLLTENRKATARVRIEADISEDFSYQQLGWAVPKRIGFRIPVFEGIPPAVSMEALMNLGAQLNTAGAVPMYHIVGLTPEAPTLEAALQGTAPEIEVLITQQDLDEQTAKFSDNPGPIDFVMFGCPHFTIRQVAEIAGLVEGRKLKTEMWVLTSSYTHEMAKRMHLWGIIERAGGHIVPDTCIDQPCWRHLYGKRGATDSPKCAYYTKRRNMSLVVRDLKTCVLAALKGSIE
jgi:cis-L-3-hydroxyproline dehydratase